MFPANFATSLRRHYDCCVAQALGRVVRKEDLEGPRGPDARHRIVVPASWLANGRWIELDLPRLLECAACAGGGCDRCDRSGAVSTRGRQELPELVEVKLPEADGNVTLRLPKRGGLPADEKSTLGRGLLMLTIAPGIDASDGVRVTDEVALVEAPEAPLAAPKPYLTPVVLFAAALALFVLLVAFVFSR